MQRFLDVALSLLVIGDYGFVVGNCFYSRRYKACQQRAGCFQAEKGK
jgi:hypothetical protein